MLLTAVGAKAGEASAGRQMPSHWGSRRLNIFTTSSPTGSECLPGVGAAEAGRYLARPESRGFLAATSGFGKDEVSVVTIGEGSTSEGEFWEALNAATHPEAPGPLPRRGQRVRDLDPGRGEHAGRVDLEGRPRLPRPLPRRGGRLRLPRLVRRAEVGLRLLPRAEGPGPRPRPRRPPLLALPLRRRPALPDGGRAEEGRRARPARADGGAPPRARPPRRRRPRGPEGRGRRRADRRRPTRRSRAPSPAPTSSSPTSSRPTPTRRPRPSTRRPPPPSPGTRRRWST